jgi:hypothetical protein
VARRRIAAVVLKMSWCNEAGDYTINGMVEFDLAEVPIVGIATNLLHTLGYTQRLGSVKGLSFYLPLKARLSSDAKRRMSCDQSCDITNTN